MDVPMLPLLVSGVIAIAGGVYFLAWGRRQRRAAASFDSDALPAVADVTDLRLRHQTYNQKHDDGFWVPVVRFSLPDGRVVESETLVGAMPAPAKVGDRVQVRYDPADPQRVNLAAGPAQPGALGCLWTALGVGGVLLGAMLLVAWYVLTSVIDLPS